ncbi:hypothetical protein Salat_0658300 [Sesamum alatum]|uniref:RING-type E3 ubiquitin transferase n=1 Tax=Sesamum alatum TaxID=300844 RepID=A0AAE1YSN6_9LAMI|nr:hypothetical protein Salat_0658300 [Sesamum alatum]
MDVFILLKLFCCIILLKTTASAATNSCTSAKCSLFSPDIRFPFRIPGLQPQQCGVPDFNLFCKQNSTMIHIPTYGDLVVKSISYDARRLSLLDPKNCVYEVFLNLNLSLTPFSYYYAVKQYKYINCSAELVDSSQQVPCLSGSDHHVYIVESSFPVPISCSFVRTVAVPFSYSPYLSADSSFGLGFTWNLVEEEATSSGCMLGILCEARRLDKYFGAIYAVSGIIAFVLMVVVLFYATLSKYDEELNEEKGKGNVW